MRPLAWVDGELLPLDAPVLDPRDSAWLHGLGCYTTARWTGSALRHGSAPAARLARDAERLGLGPLDPGLAEAALRELAEAAFASSAGVVRLQASRDGAGRRRLIGVPRPLGPEPASFRAVIAPFPHAGPGPFAGVKLSGDPRLEAARDHARAARCDEALLFDTASRLVEGARTSLVFVTADGALATPPAARGGVASLALAALREVLPELAEADLPRDALPALRELVALNAVRGARPVLEVEGRAVGDGRPGACAARLAERLDDAAHASMR